MSSQTKIYHFITTEDIHRGTGIPTVEIMDAIKEGILPAVMEHSTGMYRISGDNVEKYLRLKNTTHSMVLFHHA